MKKILLVMAVLISISFQEIDFKEIWSEGYVDGYCHEQEFCIEPITPIPPLRGVADTTFTRVYNKGFLTGLKDYRKTNR